MHESTVPGTERATAGAPDGDGAAAPQAAHVDPLLTADSRVVQILSTEHWSLLSARSLAYNEAFTRAGMFLSFLSMSFVALALLAQGIGFTRDLLIVAALVIGFTLLIGLLTFVRLLGTAKEDLRAMQGMNRIRQAYLRVVPQVEPYFSSGTTDDAEGVYRSYFAETSGGAASDIAYGFSTSQALVALVVALLAGVETALLAIVVGLAPWLAAVGGAAVTIGAIVALTVSTYRAAMAYGASLESRFPTPKSGPPG